MTRLILKPTLIVVVTLCSLVLGAQKTATFYHDNRFFHDAVDLFEKEKYAAAHEKFHDFIALSDDPREEQRIAAEFYAGICSLYLFHKDAEYVLEQFVLDHPDSPWVYKVYYELATYNYKRKKYKKALEWFEYVDPSDFNEKDSAEFYFKRGHCYFERNNYDEARQDLKQVKDLDTRYKSTATYYYSHIAYEEGSNQTALDGFLQLENDVNFQPLVPYYVTQIYYKQGRYDEVLSYSTTFLDSSLESDVKRLPEIAQIVGDAYFRQDQFESAIPYLELFHENSSKKDRNDEDYYQLGFCYYSIADYTSALDAFRQCADEDNELGQSASYYMGDCHLKLDQKPYARSAFEIASSMDHNLTMKEDALFNYAKLSFELSYNPFHEAIQAFETYLEKYPDSQRRDEAYEFLLNVYMKSRNYEAALRSLDKIQNKDLRTQEAYQVVAYNRAVELYQSEDYAGAAIYFDKVSTYPVNQSLIAESKYWKAENAYNSGSYQEAFNLYQEFILQPGSFNSDWFEEANYGAGYAQFKQKKYLNSTTAFRKYVDNYRNDDPKKLCDAYLRLGDCYYVLKDYPSAIANYDKAIDLNQINKDYGMFQKSICYGWEEKQDKKIWVLRQLIEDQPNSRFVADAKFELANAYLTTNQLTEAESYYNDLLTNHSNSPYRKRGLVDLILVAKKRNDSDAAVERWNKLLSDYPGDPICQEAYPIIADILIENGITPPENVVSRDEFEESVFLKAVQPAYQEDCLVAVPALENYLATYQPAANGIEANYHLGNCYFGSGKLDQAINAFNFVIAQPLSDFTEESLVIAATINYNKKDYVTAKGLYTELEQVALLKNNVLEAQIGLMRCSYFLGETSYALEYAEKVIVNGNTPESIKYTAFLWRGKIRFDSGEYDDAYYDFNEALKGGGEKAAEAKYNMALIAYKKEAFKPAEKEIFQLIEHYSGFNQWKYHGFLLLADVYVGLEDYFQAKATLNTVLEKVSEPWVIDAARVKLAQVEKLEIDLNSNLQIEDEVEIDLTGDDQDTRENEEPLEQEVPVEGGAPSNEKIPTEENQQ
ncbi:MAG: tetratricopeptide (TPR) repeat protein [Litorivivens sp.]|jgi:tetratricopeptide (TPR) repeat protein